MEPSVKNSKPRRTLYSRVAGDRRVSIVGAGRLGTALGIALSKAGYDVQLVVTKHSSTARRAAKAIGKNVIGVSESELARARHANLLQRSTVILIATPDDVIGGSARKTAKLFEHGPTKSRASKGTTVLHTSGARSSTELQPFEKFGFAKGSFHPLVSISNAESGSAMLRGSFFCIEGDPAAIQVATKIAKALGGQTFRVSAEQKPLYHAAAVMAAGNVVALFDIAVAMFQQCGLTEARSRQALLALTKTSIANLEKMKPHKALTGPFARGDVETVREHLSAMKSPNLQLARDAYAILGRWSLGMLASHRTAPADLKRLTKLLSDA